MDRKHKILGPSVLLITAILWGITFVVQRYGSDYVDAYTYNAIRFLISGVIMAIIYYVSNRIRCKKMDEDELKKFREECKKLNRNKKFIISSILIGVFLFLGSSFQQLGIQLTKNASKVGFISTTYIVLVPIVCLIFFKDKIKLIIWLYLLVALVGFFLISIKNDFKIVPGDFITLLAAISYAFQISIIGKVGKDLNVIYLSMIQFLIVGVLSLICMFIFDDLENTSIVKAMPSIVFAAIFSGCIAFTLQIYGQRYTQPTLATLLMSLESVFSLIFSMIILSERLTLREGVGCLLIFVSVILAQIDFKEIRRKKKYAIT